MTRILVVSPHPDDEVLGCGGTLLRARAKGAELHWLVMTRMGPDYGAARIAERETEMAKVVEAFGFASVSRLDHPAASLDAVALSGLVGEIGDAVKRHQPDVLYLPFPGDSHSDHRATYLATSACTKWFRYPSIRRVLAYETLSETDMALPVDGTVFRPTVFVDISGYLEAKIEAMRLYGAELGQPPFPRSEAVLRAQATLRGAQCGCGAAEAFMLLKEIQ